MEEKDLLQNSCGGFPYLQIRDAAFSLEADCKSAANRSSLFCLRIANPQERLTDSVLKINIGKEDMFRLTKALHQMNITSKTMYPGLDGLAKSVGRLREGLGDYKD